MLYLFGDVARIVAAKLEFTYDELEEKGREDYMKLMIMEIWKRMNICIALFYFIEMTKFII